MILGDKGRLAQIMTNLLSNAMKFTDTGRIMLTISRQDEQMIIQVSDTVIGIPPHAINYIFDEFRQVDGTATRERQGTGLGLAIVRKLCILMGGNVQVTSKVGQGSIFTITLPLCSAPEQTIITTTTVGA